MLKIGFNTDISNTDYHADREYLSSSALKLVLRDKREFHKRYILGEENAKSSPAMDLGSYIHSRVLEPGLTDAEFAVFPGTRRGKEWEAFKEQNEAKIIISRSQHLSADTAVDDLFKHEQIADLLAVGAPEHTLCATLMGVPIKVRADFFNAAGAIVDLKTTGASLQPEALTAMVYKRDYDLSAALYADAFAAELKRSPDFYFIFMSTVGAGTVAYKCSQELLDNGRRKYQKALALYLENREHNTWDESKIETMGLPLSERFE